MSYFHSQIRQKTIGVSGSENRSCARPQFKSKGCREFYGLSIRHPAPIWGIAQKNGFNYPILVFHAKSDYTNGIIH